MTFFLKKNEEDIAITDLKDFVIKILYKNSTSQKYEMFANIIMPINNKTINFEIDIENFSEISKIILLQVPPKLENIRNKVALYYNEKLLLEFYYTHSNQAFSRQLYYIKV